VLGEEVYAMIAPQSMSRANDAVRGYLRSVGRHAVLVGECGNAVAAAGSLLFPVPSADGAKEMRREVLVVCGATLDEALILLRRTTGDVLVIVRVFIEPGYSASVAFVPLPLKEAEAAGARIYAHEGVLV
jgi:hypothetical protein